MASEASPTLKRAIPQLSVAFLAGAALGWGLAQLADDRSGDKGSPPGEGSASVSIERAESAGNAFGALPLRIWELSSRVASLEALIDSLEAQRADVGVLGKQAISAMSDSEISAALMSTVQLSPDELGEVRDIRAFAERMLDVAMQGVTEPENDVPGTARVSFASACPAVAVSTLQALALTAERAVKGPAGGEMAGGPGARFPAGRRRLYANFPTPDPGREQVLVKWFRTDRPRILLMQRYPLRAGDTSAYVWLEPEGGWEVGNYQVDVYAADEAVSPLASGRYEIW